MIIDICLTLIIYDKSFILARSIPSHENRSNCLHRELALEGVTAGASSPEKGGVRPAVASLAAAGGGHGKHETLSRCPRVRRPRLE